MFIEVVIISLGNDFPVLGCPILGGKKALRTALL
jgi:hypothetical protein